MQPVDVVLAVMCAAANLAMAAVLLVRSRGGAAVPRRHAVRRRASVDVG
ncbi:hypothetical protein [Micromonospora saelicesensis]|nr:hypothetical protein [Micromonospora saelicesensis]